ncbi:hypothetical protein [Acinetobacter schindleri]|uniref:hypothetical protein n=1 Tax=Acinetobacter schindleri TaxID=108981 RepID=UPI0013B081BF|nr:hypothetical protein [Acinetobacter schindleri]QIC64393.1 hypothetical protein FSC11_08445 [Acinetobacter schindleri]
MMLDWQKWKYENRYKIQHIVGYEEKFVDEILSQIPEITPDDVVAQFPFKDSNAGNRYIDFMIINETKGYKLPIELDGYAKINNKGYEKFNDFLERQNDLIQQFGIVLRYTNKKAFNQQQRVISEIRQALKAQVNRQITDASKQKQIQSLIQEYEAKIAEYERLQVKDSQDQSVDITGELGQVRSGLNTFKQNHMKELERVRKELTDIKVQQNEQLGSVKKEIRKYVLMGAGVMASIVLGAVVYVQSKTTTPNNEILALQSSDGFSEQENDLSAHRSAQNYIEASQSSQYVGEHKVVCGQVAQYKKFSKGVYLNFDRPYPNPTFTVVIWNNNSDVSQQLQNVENNTLCVKGMIEEYKGKPQMIVGSLEQII